MVIEHQDTTRIMRLRFATLIKDKIYSDASEHSSHNAEVIYDTELLDKCTLLQLSALWDNFVSKGAPIFLHRCDPTDHLSLSIHGMYVGIEPDGYTHS